MMGSLGGDRCVLAKHPLPRPGSFTIIPTRAPLAAAGATHSDETVRAAAAYDSTACDNWQWRIARCCCSYYEVTIVPEPSAPRMSRPPLRRSQCVSVGLATSGLTIQNLRSQSGWNPSSWALHGDDGQLYHGRGQGSRFQALMGRNPQQELGPKDGNSAAAAFLDVHRQQRSLSSRNPPSFGAGDVVGCGVIDLPLAHEDGCQGIFFTLNGEFLGVCFLLSDLDKPRFWPCVGIDAHWLLDFNFGSSPFSFRVDSLHSSQLFASQPLDAQVIARNPPVDWNVNDRFALPPGPRFQPILLSDSEDEDEEEEEEEDDETAEIEAAIVSSESLGSGSEGALTEQQG
ncbi:unnamed protein product [Polarella glacialis]|uniref:SPRY domain-containing protein n=1 Tax=Polarella glacialis TaxID=89957 RepID=A0A813GFJ7_POLGL|nr:unnamed protein product [Polarella glacialis]